MTYDECLRSAYLDLESWLIFLISLAIAIALRKYGKTVFAIVSASFGLLIAVSWAYLFYEFNCVELIGL
ncbi:MAG: hypothetical protein AAFQ47_15565 [Pseudomonadota bacterium]